MPKLAQDHAKYFRHKITQTQMEGLIEYMSEKDQMHIFLCINEAKIKKGEYKSYTVKTCLSSSELQLASAAAQSKAETLQLVMILRWLFCQRRRQLKHAVSQPALIYFCFRFNAQGLEYDCKALR